MATTVNGWRCGYCAAVVQGSRVCCWSCGGSLGADRASRVAITIADDGARTVRAKRWDER
jgi:hypothetical protein